MIGCALVHIGPAIQAGVVNFGMFLASHIIIGFGVRFSSAAVGNLLSETAFPSHRLAMTSFLLANFPAGAFLAALLLRVLTYLI